MLHRPALGRQWRECLFDLLEDKTAITNIAIYHNFIKKHIAHIKLKYIQSYYSLPSPLGEGLGVRLFFSSPTYTFTLSLRLY